MRARAKRFAESQPQEPDPLDGYAEEQLDTVDASVFTGDCYREGNGRARFAWYLRRWVKELRLETEVIP